MKKFLAILMAACLCASLAACGSGNDGGDGGAFHDCKNITSVVLP